MLPPALREGNAKKIKAHKPLTAGSTTDALMRTVKFLNPIKIVDLSRSTLVAEQLSQVSIR